MLAFDVNSGVWEIGYQYQISRPQGLTLSIDQYHNPVHLSLRYLGDESGLGLLATFKSESYNFGDIYLVSKLGEDTTQQLTVQHITNPDMRYFYPEGVNWVDNSVSNLHFYG